MCFLVSMRGKFVEGLGGFPRISSTGSLGHLSLGTAIMQSTGGQPYLTAGGTQPYIPTGGFHSPKVESASSTVPVCNYTDAPYCSSYRTPNKFTDAQHSSGTEHWICEEGKFTHQSSQSGTSHCSSHEGHHQHHHCHHPACSQYGTSHSSSHSGHHQQQRHHHRHPPHSTCTGDGLCGTTSINRSATEGCCRAGEGGRTNRIWGHKAAYPVLAIGSRYIGLCMPLDLDLLLNTDGHWNKSDHVDDSCVERLTTSDNDYEETLENVVPNSNSSNGGRQNNSEDENFDSKCINDKDKWREPNDKDKWREPKACDVQSRLETVREESFNSGEGNNSLKSISLSTGVDGSSCTSNTAALTGETATNSSSSQSETGLTLHSKKTCLGCFSMCQRQEIAQPQEQIQEGSSLAAPSGVTSLLLGLGPPNLDDASSRPGTPVDRWEGLTGISGTAPKEGRVLARKEVIRYVTNMGNIIVAKASESGKWW